MKNQNNKIKAIIFDMDGVISDTQKFHAQVESETLADYGIYITPQEIVRLYAGTKDGTMFQKEFEKHNIKSDHTKLSEKKWERMPIVTKNNIKAIQGVIELITNLNRETYALAIASGSPHQFIDTVLNELKIIDKIKIRISGDDVIRAKPDPEIFLLAAKKLGISPENCLVIEDATNGVIAAKAAGMKCIAITTTHKPSDLHQADKIINSFTEISSDIIQTL